MIAMTAGEFKRYIESSNYKSFIFNSKTQIKDFAMSSINICFKFDSMMVAINPNLILLKNGRNVMYFNRVSKVYIDEECNLPYITIDVVCKDEGSYIIMAS